VGYLAAEGIGLRGQRVLDLGAGEGGYSLAFKAAGALVVAIDLHSQPGSFEVPYATADAMQLPFRSCCFDLVVCSSLIEHVPTPRLLLGETSRVLRKGGFLYLSFPPFYSLYGGHQFSPFHLLGERLALTLASRRFRHTPGTWLHERYPVPPVSFARAYGSWGLFPMTIRQARQLTVSLPFVIKSQSTRWLPFDISHIPIVGEVFTWHVQFLAIRA
jgi:SAM-dependent methyltransferase